MTPYLLRACKSSWFSAFLAVFNIPTKVLKFTKGKRCCGCFGPGRVKLWVWLPAQFVSLSVQSVLGYKLDPGYRKQGWNFNQQQSKLVQTVFLPDRVVQGYSQRLYWKSLSMENLKNVYIYYIVSYSFLSVSLSPTFLCQCLCDLSFVIRTFHINPGSFLFLDGILMIQPVKTLNNF